MIRPLVILKAGSTWPETAARLGDFDDWVRAGLGLPADEVAVVELQAGDALPDPSEVAGAVVTGSHAMVTDRESWSEATARWLARAVAAERPILGICYGHQLLAHALGGVVDYHPGGREIGTVPVRLTEAGCADPLLGTLPEEFPAHVTHAQSVRILPPGAVHLAGNEFERNHAFRVGASAWGVQFHPEFSAAAMTAYIDGQADALRAAGNDVPALRAGVAPTPESASLLARFILFTLALN